MSTTEWTHPVTEIKYPIGTEGREFFSITRGNGIIDTISSIVRSSYNNIKGFVDVLIPTYGLWAGPGWAGGMRYPGEENGQIGWGTKPCFNENVKGSATPQNCYSVVDAITKTHDWQYVRPLTGSAIPQGSAIIIEYIPCRKKLKALHYAHMLCCAASVGVAAYTKSTPHFSGFARLASEHI